MLKALRRFAGDDSGAAAIEYGMIALAIAIVLVATLPYFTKKLPPLFQATEGALSDYLSKDASDFTGE